MVLERTERELVEACQRGERDAFRALFEQHKDKVYSVALRYSGSAPAAMDIAQDVFLKLFSCIGSFRGESGFESWLFRMVVNGCLDQKRRTKRLMPLGEAVLEALRWPGRGADDEIQRAETSARVQSAVGTLPPEQRMVVVLRYTQGLSYEEIAEALGCSAGTVASRLNRAHRTLERRLASFAGERGGARV